MRPNMIDHGVLDDYDRARTRGQGRVSFFGWKVPANVGEPVPVVDEQYLYVLQRYPNRASRVSGCDWCVSDGPDERRAR